MRKFSTVFVLVCVMIGLAACGSDNGEKTPTPEPAEQQSQAPTVAPTTPATATADPGASPGAIGIVASPVGSPEGSAMASPVAGVPDGSGTITLSGVLVLPGSVNEDFLISDDGCVGIGSYTGLAVGQQVVVRDEGGTIIAVTTLQGGGDAVSCEWVFTSEVPAADYYEITVPNGEQVFTGDEVEQGPVEIVLP